MSTGDKIRNSAEKFTGGFRQKVGRASGNRELEVRGYAQRTRANLNQIAEKVKDVFRR